MIIRSRTLPNRERGNGSNPEKPVSLKGHRHVGVGLEKRQGALVSWGNQRTLSHDIGVKEPVITLYAVGGCHSIVGAVWTLLALAARRTIVARASDCQAGLAPAETVDVFAGKTGPRSIQGSDRDSVHRAALGNGGGEQAQSDQIGAVFLGEAAENQVGITPDVELSLIEDVDGVFDDGISSFLPRHSCFSHANCFGLIRRM